MSGDEKDESRRDMSGDEKDESRRDMSGDEKDESFADAVRGVRPLRGRKQLRQPAEPGRSPRPRPEPPQPRRFLVEWQGDDVRGRREDVSRRQLGELSRGRPPAERELDLHGMGADAARRETFAAIERARVDVLRCLLVIHGTGQHSQAGPVLKRALPGWLQEDAVSGSVLAFATAGPRHGGAGATLVLLRRARG